MSHTMTWATLTEDVESYCDRHSQDFLDQIPRFISLAENRIATEVSGLGYTRYVIGGLLTGQPVVEKPVNWRETKMIRIGTGVSFLESKFLGKRDYGYCQVFWPNRALTDEPRYYTEYGYNNIQVVPTPDQDYPLEWVYHEKPVDLSVSSQTNWTTEYAPQLLLYATLMEAAGWLKDEKKVQTWTVMYEQFKKAVKDQELARLTDASSKPEV